MSGQAVPISSETQTNLNSVSNVCTSVPMNEVSVSTSTMVSVEGNKGSSEVPAADLGRLIKKPNTSSSHWKNFKVYEKDHSKVRCLVPGCKHPEFKINDSSTGHLIRHNHTYHREDEKKSAETEVRQFHMEKNSNELSNLSGSKRDMDGFVTRHHAPNFLMYAVIWIAMTYQPLCTMVDFFFRQMCLSLNPKAQKEVAVGKDGLKFAILKQAAEVKVLLEIMLKGQFFSLTLDGWTSIQGISYLGVTIHWISDNWTMCSCALGCFAKSGKSAAVDYLAEVVTVLERFDLEFSTFVAAVTDTEATMNLFGKLLVAESLQRGGGLFWHGCVDHLLELTTGIAFDDTPGSQETMKKCRALVGHFNGSTQAIASLRETQISLGIKALMVIADVVTRWWSTWMMCQRLVFLRPYLTVMVATQKLSATFMLTEPQWGIVQEIVHILEPFMIVQKQLEGEKYVTISLVPYLIWKVL